MIGKDILFRVHAKAFSKYPTLVKSKEEIAAEIKDALTGYEAANRPPAPARDPNDPDYQHGLAGRYGGMISARRLDHLLRPEANPEQVIKMIRGFLIAKLQEYKKKRCEYISRIKDYDLKDQQIKLVEEDGTEITKMVSRTTAAWIRYDNRCLVEIKDVFKNLKNSKYAAAINSEVLFAAYQNMPINFYFLQLMNEEVFEKHWMRTYIGIGLAVTNVCDIVPAILCCAFGYGGKLLKLSDSVVGKTGLFLASCTLCYLQATVSSNLGIGATIGKIVSAPYWQYQVRNDQSEKAQYQAEAPALNS